MKVIARDHALVLASIALGIAAAVLIAYAGTAGGYAAQAAPQSSQMIAPF